MLGEEITHEDEARTIARAYRDALAAIEHENLDSNVSVKPTALGLALSYELCRENLESILRRRATGNFVRIDMEDSSTTSDTLRMYRELREDGFDNVGVVLQAYLRRTLDDVAALADLDAERPPLQGHLRRAGVDRVHRRRRDTRELRQRARRAARRRRVRRDRDARRVADRRGARPRRRHRTRASTSSRCCSACASGARRSSSRDGHRLRVYVPFGEQWYEYSLRRLQENPAMAGTIAKATVDRVLGRS